MNALPLIVNINIQDYSNSLQIDSRNYVKTCIGKNYPYQNLQLLDTVSVYNELFLHKAPDCFGNGPNKNMYKHSIVDEFTDAPLSGSFNTFYQTTDYQTDLTFDYVDVVIPYNLHKYPFIQMWMYWGTGPYNVRFRVKKVCVVSSVYCDTAKT